jgi:hypothetical protein
MHTWAFLTRRAAAPPANLLKSVHFVNKKSATGMPQTGSGQAWRRGRQEHPRVVSPSGGREGQVLERTSGRETVRLEFRPATLSRTRAELAPRQTPLHGEPEPVVHVTCVSQEPALDGTAWPKRRSARSQRASALRLWWKPKPGRPRAGQSRGRMRLYADGVFPSPSGTTNVYNSWWVLDGIDDGQM